MSEQLVHFLIVTKRPALRDLVQFALEWRFDCVVTSRASEKEALEYLREIEVFPHMIIYDYESDAFLVEDFIAAIKATPRHVHFLVLAEKIQKPYDDYFRHLPLFRLLMKDQFFQEITEIAQKAFSGVIKDGASDWCRLGVEAVQKTNGIHHLLHMQLPSGKKNPIQIDSALEQQEILARYQAKGLDYVWLERSECGWVEEQLNRQFHLFLGHKGFRFVLRAPSASRESMFEQKILRIDEELHVDPEFRQEVQMIMNKVLEAVQKDMRLGQVARLLKEKDPKINYFAKDLQLMSVVTCWMAKKMEWNSKTTLEKLVTASVLKDITLAFRPQLQGIATLSEFEQLKHRLTEEDQKLFLNHTRECAAIVKNSFKYAPPETEVLILQHHELPDGSGFPAKLSHDKLSPLVQLFIVAHDLVRYVMKEDEPMLDVYLLKAEARFEPHTFKRFLHLIKKFK